MSDDAPIKFVFDCSTGIGSYQPLTDDEVAQLQADQAAAAEAAEVAAATAAAVNEGTLLAKRNRWLFETDPYNLATGAIDDIPLEVTIAVQQNLDAIKSWRQQLRDYPDTVTDWTNPPALPEPPDITLPSGSPLFRLT